MCFLLGWLPSRPSLSLPLPFPWLDISLTNSWNARLGIHSRNAATRWWLDSAMPSQQNCWGKSLKIIPLMQDVCCYYSHANSEPVQEAASTGKLVPLLQLQVRGRACEDGKCTRTIMLTMVCINKKLNPTFPPFIDHTPWGEWETISEKTSL